MHTVVLSVDVVLWVSLSSSSTSNSAEVPPGTESTTCRTPVYLRDLLSRLWGTGNLKQRLALCDNPTGRSPQPRCTPGTRPTQMTRVRTGNGGSRRVYTGSKDPKWTLCRKLRRVEKVSPSATNDDL